MGQPLPHVPSSLLRQLLQHLTPLEPAAERGLSSAANSLKRWFKWNEEFGERERRVTSFAPTLILAVIYPPRCEDRALPGRHEGTC